MRRFAPLPLDNLLPLLANSRDWVLLDTSLPGHENRYSYLFHEPVELIEAEKPDQVKPALERLDRAVGVKKLWTAGYLAYEAGFGLENSLKAPPAGYGQAPLLWFGLFERPYIFDHGSGKWLGQAPPEYAPAPGSGQWSVTGLALDATEDRFSADVERIRELIALGRTYQVNYTRRWNFAFDGDPLALYRRLRDAQPVPYGALLHAGGTKVLSLSPELFYRTAPDGRIVTRPMKGTIARGLDTAHDRRQAAALRNDRKNRAENLMIVDLLRNDLGRVCRVGSVRAPRLFEVERYRSLLQMTSTVEGKLLPGAGLAEIMGSIFPSGSVTGAPKISTMEIIGSLEDSPRGVYTGAIGFAAPDGRSCFNVAIRTLELRDGRGVMGAGCGIVADSRGSAEYAECRLKARFLTAAVEAAVECDFRLIETMLAVDGGIELLEFHLDRLRDSSRYFGRPFSRRAVRTALVNQLAGRLEALKVRLLLDCRGEYSIEINSFMPPVGPLKIALWPGKIDSSGEFFRHKTTNRHFYDNARKQAQSKGLFDYVFVNSSGWVTEGAISNIYLEKNGVLFTPPLRCGVLPGVCRRALKSRGKFPVRDKLLTPDDLRAVDRLWVSNAVIGLVAAELVE